jgi:hypothetical protein
MRCRICNYCSTTKEPDLTESIQTRQIYKKAFWKDNEDLCSVCIKSIREAQFSYKEETPEYTYGKAVDIDKMLDDLFVRIPGLFSGKECPIDFTSSRGCDCTFKTGCKALKEHANKKT